MNKFQNSNNLKFIELMKSTYFFSQNQQLQ